MKVFAVLLSCVAAATATLDFVAPEAPLAIPAKEVGAQQDDGIILARTFKSLNKVAGSVTVDHGCTDHDDHGSNNCNMNWGETYNITYDVELDEDLNEKSILDVKLTLDGLIPFHISCAICGVDCTFTVPIIKKKIVLPFSNITCPVKAGKVSGSVALALPANDPVPLKISFEGGATFHDDAGTSLGEIDIKGSVQK